MARVLIVEDYESLQNVYSMVLKQAGHTVKVVDDGITAFDATKESEYDVILLDLLLPHVSGMEFLESYKPKDHPTTKVIICSNFTSPKYIERSKELGVNHHLTKSNVTPKQVAEEIAKVLTEP